MSTHPRRIVPPPLRTVVPDGESRLTFWWTAVSVHVVWAVGCWTWAMSVVPPRTAAAITGALVVFAALALNALWLTSRPVVVGGVVAAGVVKLLMVVGATTASGFLMAFAAGLAAMLIGSTRLLARAYLDEARPGPMPPDRRS